VHKESKIQSNCSASNNCRDIKPNMVNHNNHNRVDYWRRTLSVWLNNQHGHSYGSTTTRIFWGLWPWGPRLSDSSKSFPVEKLSAAAAGFLIGGRSLAYRLDSTWKLIDCRRRRTAAVPGSIFRQTLPTIENSPRKELRSGIKATVILDQLPTVTSDCPILGSSKRNDQETAARPFTILKISIKSALFRHSSKDHKSNWLSLSSHGRL